MRNLDKAEADQVCVRAREESRKPGRGNQYAVLNRYGEYYVGMDFDSGSLKSLAEARLKYSNCGIIAAYRKGGELP